MKVVLIGFAASYKTSAGKLLAEKLGYDFWDVDEEVERQSGKRVSQIFADDGEKFFRDRENEVLRQLTKSSGVIACGGGSVLAENFSCLIKGAVVVWLKTSVHEVKSRLQSGIRPLFDGLTEEELAARLVDREEIYKRFAQITVSTDGKTSRQVADEIFELTQRTD